MVRLRVIDDGIFHIARNDSNAFSWDDFPEINDQPKVVKDNLSQMTRTALAFREIYYPHLTNNWQKVKNESWRALLGAPRPPNLLFSLIVRASGGRP